jgi:hypothetical protein
MSNGSTGGVPGDHQASGRDMQAGRVVGAGVPQWHDDQMVPLEVNHVSAQFFGQHRLISKLTGKLRLPQAREDRRFGLLVHALHHCRRGDYPSVGETIQERSEAKEMIAVTVRSVDRRQALALCRDPLPQGLRLLDSEQGIDEHGVSLPGDEGRRDRRKHPLLPAWRQVMVCNGDARRDVHVPVLLLVASFAISHVFVSFASYPSLLFQQDP